jgi:hypothetical protein
MKRISHQTLYILSIALATSVPVPAVAQATSHDSYAAMLGYLDANAIGGNVAEGAQGITSINTAAGNGNQQANLHAFALGAHASAQLQARQRAYGNAVATTPLNASAVIGGHAYAEGQGMASINQASGNGNAQLNGVAAQLADQGIREASDGMLSATVSVSAQKPHTPTDGTRSVAVAPSAMQGFNGVMQLNQVAGAGNASSNLLLLSAPASPH